MLLKPGPLTPDEFELMKRHPEIGDSLCAPLQSLRRVRPIVLCHHERIDGSGYPAGLRGDEVPLLAQIVGIVDVYDALTSARSYRPAWLRGDAIRYLRDEVTKGKFHAHHVETFLETLAATTRRPWCTDRRADACRQRCTVLVVAALAVLASHGVWHGRRRRTQPVAASPPTAAHGPPWSFLGRPTIRPSCRSMPPARRVDSPSS